MHYLHPWKKHVKKKKTNHRVILNFKKRSQGWLLHTNQKEKIKREMLAVIMGSVQKRQGDSEQITGVSTLASAVVHWPRVCCVNYSPLAVCCPILHKF